MPLTRTTGPAKDSRCASCLWFDDFPGWIAQGWEICHMSQWFWTTVITLWWTNIAMERSTHFEWENPLFLWPFSIAFCRFTRGYSNYLPSCGMPWLFQVMWRSALLRSRDGRQRHFVVWRNACSDHDQKTSCGSNMVQPVLTPEYSIWRILHLLFMILLEVYSFTQLMQSWYEASRCSKPKSPHFWWNANNGLGNRESSAWNLVL